MKPLTPAEWERYVLQLKRDAKRLKREKGCAHAEALDITAFRAGYSNWSQFMLKGKQENAK